MIIENAAHFVDDGDVYIGNVWKGAPNVTLSQTESDVVSLWVEQNIIAR